MRVPLQGVSITQLADGYAGKAIDAAINAVVKDIADRGDDGLARKVTIQFTFVPTAAGRVDIDVQVKNSVPALRPPKTQAKIDLAAGALVINPDCSENPDQLTFNDLPPKSGG